MVIAHRGASGHRPEHTGEAYRLALRMGADAVEPDVVPSRDGVLVVRHENELSTTTDVADHAELAGRRTTKHIDGVLVEGWFTEDLTWQELTTLRARERIPALRPENTRFDGRWPLLRLADVLRLVQDEASSAPAHVVVELKHPTFFREAGLPLEELLEHELDVAGVDASPDWLTVESFEKSALSAVAGRGLRSRRVYLAEPPGTAFDLVTRDGSAAVAYADELSASGIRRLGGLSVPGPDGQPQPHLHGVSVAKPMLLDDPTSGRRLVEQAHNAGLTVWSFTLRPENWFLADRHRDGPDAALGRWRDEFAEMIATGVDGVFADHPDLVRTLYLPDGAPCGILASDQREDDGA